MSSFVLISGYWSSTFLITSQIVLDEWRNTNRFMNRVSDWVLGNEPTAKTMSSCLSVIIKSVFLLSGRRSSSHCNVKTIPNPCQLEHATGAVNARACCSAAPLPVQVSPSAVSQSPWCDAAPVINTALPRLAPRAWDLLSFPHGTDS